MNGWGHYGDFTLEATFLLCMAAWNLLWLDLVQQLKRYNKRKKAREEWKSSFRS